MSLILNIAFVGLLIPAGLLLAPATLCILSVITQFACHVKFKDTSQLINSMSNVLQKLVKYFNGTIISTFFSILIPSNFSVIKRF